MSVKIEGLEAVQKALAHLGDELSPPKMQRKMATLGGMVQNTIEESFDKEASPFGVAWKTLDDKTKKAKAKKRQSSRKLRASGALADKWQTHATPTSAHVFGGAKSKKGFEYGKVHQWGSRHVEARPFLPITKEGKIEATLAEDMLEVLKKAFTP